MTSTGPRLWHAAWQNLPPKYQDVLPTVSPTTPEDVIGEVKKQITIAKGKPITLPNGSTFFVRDVLEKISHWVRRFIEVGDVAVQYDPAHAALPWAALRLLLQASINNVNKHAAILEGIDAVSRWLVWGRTQENSLEAQPQGQRYTDLEQTFVQLYEYMLTLLARSIKFLQKEKHIRMLDSFFSSGSKFRKNVDDIVRLQGVIREYTSQLTGSETLKLMQELQRPILRIDDSTQQTLDAINRSQQQAVLDWVSVLAYEKHHKDIASKVLEGTGIWLFQDPSYFGWQNSSSSEVLWLRGGAGFGKSTLLSMVVQDLIQAYQDDQAPYPLYFYCLRNTAEPERADAACILRSLVRQAFSLPSSSHDPALQPRYENRKTSGDILIKEAEDLLLSAIASRRLTYICIDALDECTPRDREILIDALEKILQTSTSLVKIFVTSREYDQDILISMEGYPEVRIDTNKNKKDIELYVREKVEKAASKRKLLPPKGVTGTLQEKIIESLCDGAQGMFRWVELQLEYLYTIRIRSMLLNRLGSLPPGLEQSYRELYDLKMDELGEDQGDIVKRILSWLLISQRPLDTGEMRQLSLIDSSGQDITNETIIEICFSLVRLDSEQDQFRFSHPSVREFLEKKPDYQPRALHEMAESLCLDFIMKSQRYKATHYAAIYWPFHAGQNEEYRKASQTEQHEHEHEKRFFRQPANAFIIWCEKLDQRFPTLQIWDRSEAKQRVRRCLSSEPHPCFVCASFGLMTELRKMLADENSEKVVHLENKDGNKVLYLASLYAQREMVQLLLDSGADVNAQGGEYGNALQAASLAGSVEVVELLLDSGADIGAQGGELGNALQAASYRGHQELVKLLVRRGADVNAQGGKFCNALCAALWSGCSDIVRLLLESGADLDASESGLDVALQSAAYGGDQKMVRQLLDRGADVNAQGRIYGNALHASSYNGFQEVAQLLLDEGADVNAQHDDDGSALQVSSEQGHLGLVQLLLDRGADANAPGGYHGNALQAASRSGHKEIVQLLLEKGADVNSQGGHWGHALPAASWSGHLDVVKLLLERGADLDSQPRGEHGSALESASRRCRLEVVKALLDSGAQVDSYALRSACRGGHLEVVRLLLDGGADINAKLHFNALLCASQRDHQQVVELLLESGAEVNTPGGVFSSSLLAQFYDRPTDSVTPLLLEDGTSVATLSPDSLGRSFLHCSARYNSSRGIRAAIESGMNIDETDRHKWSPLHWAAYFGSVEAIQTLVDSGADAACRDWQGWNPERLASFCGHKAAGLILSAARPGNSQDANVAGENLVGSCDYCGHDLVEEHHHCVTCGERPSYDLCFRCIRDVDILHPGHSFTADFRHE